MSTKNTLDNIDEFSCIGSDTKEEQVINQAIHIEPVSEKITFQDQLQRQPVTAEVSQSVERYIYAAGILRPHFPSEGLKKEYETAARIVDVNPRDYYKVFTYTDDQGHQVYRYIAEQVSWILSINDQDVYVSLPNSSDELDEFINTLKSNGSASFTDDVLSVIIGLEGPIAPEELSADLPLPMVMCKHIYSFTSETISAELSKKTNTTSTYIRNVLDALLAKPNIGSTDIARAKNFIAYRYSSIYIDTSAASDCQSAPDDNEYLESMEAKPSFASPGRNVIDLIFTYKKNVSGRTNSYYVSVDVTDQFPFLNSDLKDYIPTN